MRAAKSFARPVCIFPFLILFPFNKHTIEKYNVKFVGDYVSINKIRLVGLNLKELKVLKTLKVNQIGMEKITKVV